MDWTPKQREQIILHYGHEGVAFCPVDHELLVADGGHLGRAGVNLRCPKCNRQLMSSPVPLGVTWTPMPALSGAG